MFTYSHANTPLSQSEHVYYLSYFITINNKGQVLVGHVPIELSKICSRFLHDYGQIEAECTGAQYNRRGKRT